MRYRLKTLLIIISAVACVLAIVVAIREYRRDAKQNALIMLKDNGVLLLRSSNDPESIEFAEIWLSATSDGYFLVNGTEYSKRDANRLLLSLRVSLERLQIDRMVLVDNEPGTTVGRESTTTLAHLSGFVSLGGQSGNSTYKARRKLFESKDLLFH